MVAAEKHLNVKLSEDISCAAQFAICLNWVMSFFAQQHSQLYLF